MGGRTTCAALWLLLALLLSVQGGEASGAAAAKAEPEFYPPDGMHVAMYILVGIALLVAAGGGVGGGPMLVPLYLLMGRFSNTAAVALSNCSIFAASVANVLIVVPRRRHPTKDRPLVAWDLILLMQPPTSIGAIWGAYINKLVPAWIAQVLLAIMLSVLTRRMANRAMFIYKKESLALLPAAGACAAAGGKAAAAPSKKKGRGQRGKEKGKEKGQVKEQEKEKGQEEGKEKSRSSKERREARVRPEEGASGQQEQREGALMQAEPLQQTEDQAPPSKQQAAEQLQDLEDESQQQEQEQGAVPQQAQRQVRLSAARAIRTTAADSDNAPASPKASARVLGQPLSQPAAAAPAGPATGTAPASPSEPAVDPVSSTAAKASLAAQAAARAAGVCAAVSAGNEPISRNGGSSGGEGSSGRASNGETSRDSSGGGSSEISSAAGDSGAEPQPGLLPWEPSVLPTLEVEMAMDGEDDWEAFQKSRRYLMESEESEVKVPPSEAESKLAYAPPQERPEGDLDPDLGGGTVDGVPVTQEEAGGKLPAPEVAASKVGDDLEKVLQAEAQQLPPWHLAGLLVLCAALLLTSMFSKLQECGGWRFWVIQAAAVPVLVGVALVARWDILRKARIRKAAQVDWSGEIRWSRKNTLVFPGISVLAGVVAGVFGLGGGIVFTPLMLELGTHPQVTAATTQTMLLFTTGASTIVFAQMGSIPWKFAVVIMAIVFFSTLIGQMLIDRLVRRAGRGSIVVIVLSVFFGCACILSYFVAVRSVVAFTKDPVGTTKAQGIC